MSRLGEDRMSGARFCALGCVLFSIVSVGATDPADSPTPVRSRTFDLQYHVNADAGPLDSVELWFTRDGGESWSRFGSDEDRQSPIPFTASTEGLHGFYLVVTNSGGASGPPPGPASKPHLWAFIDYTPPVVQLHPLELEGSSGERTIRVRWTALDANFPARPIELVKALPPDEVWSPVSVGPVANTGRYDWRIGEQLTGSVAVRVTARDQAGNSATSEPRRIDLPVGEPGAAPLPPPEVAVSLTGLTSLPIDTALSGSTRAKEHASQLFAEAVACRERGEFREAIARLRDVVRLNPQFTDAFVEMGRVLYRLGDLEKSLEAYGLAIRLQPSSRAALRGAAMAHTQRKDYASATKLLRTLLRYYPQDADVWVNLGDVAVYQGDELLAREAYTRATQVDPSATKAIADARKRIELMQGASRTSRSMTP